MQNFYPRKCLKHKCEVLRNWLSLKRCLKAYNLEKGRNLVQV